MTPLNLIDEGRLALMPKNYWAAHEFCFHLHDTLAKILVEFDSLDIHNDLFKAFDDAFEGKEEELEKLDIISFLQENKLIQPYKLHILSNSVLALTRDMLDFIFEALKCFEKRKFSVGFSLLRKPLKEHLLFLSWIIANEDDFISKFEKDNHISFNSTTNSKEKRLELIDNAISKLYMKDFFSAELIWQYIYSKNHEGFEPTFQKATHLTTSKGELLKTEEYSLNFIFEDKSDDYYYDFLKTKLPYIFLYISQIILQSFKKFEVLDQKFVSHHILSTIGCYEALFIDARSMNINKTLQKTLKSMLACIHCDEPFKILKRNAAQLYLHECFLCKKCGLISEFPLYWLLAKGNLTITEDDAFDN